LARTEQEIISLNSLAKARKSAIYGQIRPKTYFKQMNLVSNVATLPRLSVAMFCNLFYDTEKLKLFK
jgi:hypothetical protein